MLRLVILVVWVFCPLLVFAQQMVDEGIELTVERTRIKAPRPSLNYQYYLDKAPFNALDEVQKSIDSLNWLDCDSECPNVKINERLWVKITLEMGKNSEMAFSGYLYFGRHDRVFIHEIYDGQLEEPIKMGGLYKTRAKGISPSSYYYPYSIDPGETRVLLVQLSSALHNVDNDPIEPTILRHEEFDTHRLITSTHWAKPYITLGILSIIAFSALLFLLLYFIFKQLNLLAFFFLNTAIVLHNIRLLEYYLDKAIIWGHMNELTQRIELPLRLMIALGFYLFTVTYFDFGKYRKTIYSVIAFSLLLGFINAFLHFISIGNSLHFDLLHYIFYYLDFTAVLFSGVLVFSILWRLKRPYSRIFIGGAVGFLSLSYVGMFLTSQYVTLYQSFFSGDLIVLSAVFVFLALMTYMVYKRLYDHSMALVVKALKVENLEEIQRVKSQFFANVTHDLRTPITVLQSYLRKLDMSKQDRDVVIRNVNKLNSLVDEMLDLSSLQAGMIPIDYSDFDLVKLVDGIALGLRPLATQKNIELFVFSQNEQMFIESDKSKIDQMITNLVSNAIEYTPIGGRIIVVLSIENAWVKFEVRDNGIPIPEQFHESIFGRYERVDEQSPRHSGLGLSIVRELTQRLDGLVELRTNSKGNIFKISLPYRQVTSVHHSITEVPSTYLPSASDIKEFRILIVEDNVDLLKYYSSILSLYYEVYTATDGKKGIELAQEQIPDIVITDVMMPEIGGYELTKLLRKNKHTAHIPVIIITAKKEVSERIDSWQAGADFFLSKPFEDEELLSMIDNALRNLQKRQNIIRNQIGMPQGNVMTNDPFIDELHDFIENNIDVSEIDMDQMAKSVGLSRSQMYRKIKQLSGLNPTELILHVRLERAWHLLKDGNHRVSEVAYMCGFKDPSYFSRVFKKTYQYTPTEHLEGGVKEQG